MGHFDLKLVELSIKRVAADAKSLGHVADIPAMLRYELQQHRPFMGLQRLECL